MRGCGVSVDQWYLGYDCGILSTTTLAFPHFTHSRHFWHSFNTVLHNAKLDFYTVLQELWLMLYVWVCLKIEICEIHKMYEIQCLNIEIHA